MKRISNKVLELWRVIIFGVVLAVVLGLLLFWHIGSRPAGLSSEESQVVNHSLSLKHIYNNPLNAPLTIPEHFLLKVSPHSQFAARATSAGYATLAIILFFLVLLFWQDAKTALLGTALFGTSSWFLHVARLDTPDVLSLAVILALGMGLWLKHSLKRNLVLVLCGLVSGALLYVPGMIWFMLIGLAWTYKGVRHELKHTNIASRALAPLLFLAAIEPLVMALIKHPERIWLGLGLPEHFAKLATLGHNFVRVPLWLFWHGPASDPTHWLGTTPVLNIFEIVMLVLGVYSFWRYRQLGRSKAVLGGLLVSWVLVALGGPITLTILLPFLYIAIAGGVLYMLETWFKVFPANPVARTAGVLILVIACAISCNYHLQNYFVAWRHSPTTNAAFTHKLD